MGKSLLKQRDNWKIKSMKIIHFLNLCRKGMIQDSTGSFSTRSRHNAWADKGRTGLLCRKPSFVQSHALQKAEQKKKEPLGAMGFLTFYQNHLLINPLVLPGFHSDAGISCIGKFMEDPLKQSLYGLTPQFTCT